MPDFATALDGLPLLALASGHTVGASTFVLASGSGTTIGAQATRQGAPTLSSSAPYYFFAVPQGDVTGGQITSVSGATEFKCTGLSTDTLTGVSLLYSGTTTDPGYSTGDFVFFGTLAQFINDLNAQVIANASSIGGKLAAASNLSDIASASTARTNLGLGTAATQASSTFEQVANKGQNSGYAGLDSGGKVPIGQLPSSIIGGVDYQGTWDASANSPTLTGGTGTKGFYYKVSVAGSTTLDTNTNWHVGDWVVFDGTVWEKIDNFEAVNTVAGRTGNVVISTSDVSGLSSYPLPAGNLTGTVPVANLPQAFHADTDGSTITFDCSLYERHSVTLGGNRTLAVSGDVNGQIFEVLLVQDGTGSRTVTWWSGIKWSGTSSSSTPPTLSTTAAARDILTFQRLGSGDYVGTMTFTGV